MDYEVRYSETRLISSELWKLYKQCLEEMDGIIKCDDEEQDKWWSDVTDKFQTIVSPWNDTTHEFYANSYCIACLEDIRQVWSLKTK